MAETRTFFPGGELKRLIIDNSDKSLVLMLENLQRTIPQAVAKITYQEFDAQDIQTYTVTKTREQLLRLTDTYSYVYDYQYYPSGAINTIRIRVFDALDVLLSDHTVKHYEDGRPPEVLA